MPKPTLVSTADPAPMPPLPSEHVNHSTVYQNETQVRLSAFESGIVTLQGEMEGQHSAFTSAVEKLKIEFERKTAELTKEHNASKADLLRRIGDMQLGKAMSEAALDAWNNGKEAK